MTERIQKFLATRGLGSRREIERMVAEGRITVNGQVAEPGQAVSEQDRIQLDKRPVHTRSSETVPRVLVYHKPEGELVTRDDPEGRPTVFPNLPRLRGARWIAVGRLDINTSGLLLLTTDGELAQRLMHPKHQVTREYAVRIFGEVTDEMLQNLRNGVMLEDGPASFEDIVAADSGEGRNQWFHCSLTEGRNREVRRLWESQDLQVSRLMRIRYGPIRLESHPRRGRHRELTIGEINLLRDTVELPRLDDAVAKQAEASRRSFARQRGRGGHHDKSGGHKSRRR